MCGGGVMPSGRGSSLCQRCVCSRAVESVERSSACSAKKQIRVVVFAVFGEAELNIII